MRSIRLKNGILIVACVVVAALASGARAVDCFWLHPCSSNDMDCRFDFCNCEANWNSSGNWSCSGYPNTTSENAIIEHENLGDACPVDTGEEGWLQLFLSTDTIGALTIKVKYVAGLEELRLAFWDATRTLTVNDSIIIDAANGDIVFEVGNGAKLVTN